jgi:hypothetical protein
VSADQAAEARAVETPDVDRNRTTVRRAVRAGLVVGAVAAALMLVLAVQSKVSGGAVLAAAITGWGVATAGWLLLAALLDVLAGEPPNLRRVLWTAAATLVAMLGPFLLLGTLLQPVAS